MYFSFPPTLLSPSPSLCFSVIYLPRWAHGCQRGATKTPSLTIPLTTESVPGRLSGPSTLLQVTNTHTHTHCSTLESWLEAILHAPVWLPSYPQLLVRGHHSGWAEIKLWLPLGRFSSTVRKYTHPRTNTRTNTLPSLRDLFSIVKHLNQPPAQVWCNFPSADRAARINGWRNEGTGFREVKGGRKKAERGRRRWGDQKWKEDWGSKGRR